MSIPVILDTDIGHDIDDVWALALLLASPEVDLRLVVSEAGDTSYAAALVCKILEVAGRTDIPVGVGIPLNTTARTHAGWLGGYQLQDYPGLVIEDGVGAMIDAINEARPDTTLLSIGPVPNIAHALQRDPGIARHARFVGMHGSLRRGYLGADKPHREYNVKQYPQAFQRVFDAPWPITLAPLDACGVVSVNPPGFERLASSPAPLAQAVIGNHLGWAKVFDASVAGKTDLTRQSSILYDTVAAWLTFSEAFLQMEDLGVRATDDGRTEIFEQGKRIRCATGWQDMTAFETMLVDRLTGAKLPAD
ncbi:MAG: nucleoside hydrolase [Pseudomonadota bacterium]